MYYLLFKRASMLDSSALLEGAYVPYADTFYHQKSVLDL